MAFFGSRVLPFVVVEAPECLNLFMGGVGPPVVNF